jgi:hypothetical protein
MLLVGSMMEAGPIDAFQHLGAERFRNPQLMTSRDNPLRWRFSLPAHNLRFDGNTVKR